MKENELHENTLRAYLLGTLTDEETERLERRLMTEDQSFRELLIGEDDLVDDYLRGHLSKEDRIRFASRFLSTPDRQLKLRFAAILQEYMRVHGRRAQTSLSRHSGRRTSWDWLFELAHHAASVRSLTPAVLAIAVLAGVWTVVRYPSREAPFDPISPEHETLPEKEAPLLEAGPGSAELVEANSQPTTPSSSPSIATSRGTFFTLSSGLLRGEGEMTRLRVPSDESLIELRLDIGIDEYPEYRAALYVAEGIEVWTQSRLKANATSTGAMIFLTLPSTVLVPGDYYVGLDGITEDGTSEAVGRYDFRASQ